MGTGYIFACKMNGKWWLADTNQFIVRPYRLNLTVTEREKFSVRPMWKIWPFPPTYTKPLQPHATLVHRTYLSSSSSLLLLSLKVVRVLFFILCVYTYRGICGGHGRRQLGKTSGGPRRRWCWAKRRARDEMCGASCGWTVDGVEESRRWGWRWRWRNRCGAHSVIDSQLRRRRRRIPGVKPSTSSAWAHAVPHVHSTHTHTRARAPVSYDGARSLGRCHWLRRLMGGRGRAGEASAKSPVGGAGLIDSSRACSSPVPAAAPSLRATSRRRRGGARAVPLVASAAAAAVPVVAVPRWCRRWRPAVEAIEAAGGI